MSTRTKLLVLGATTIVLVALLLLAGSLPGLELRGGQPFPLQLSTMESGSGAFSGKGSLLLLNAMRIFIIALLPFAILYLLFTPEGRQRLLSTIIALGILLLLFSFLASQQTELVQPIEPMQALSPLEAPLGNVEAPEFVPGDTRNLVTAISIGIGVTLTLVLIGVVWAIWRRRRPPATSTLVQLGQEAQDALDDIQAGGDLKNAVIRCYVEMSHALSEQRGIERGVTMTTREFEERLVREGMPEPPVRQLTRLFEDVRYGAQAPGLAEEQRAVQCLTAIVTAVRENGQVTP